MRIAIISDVDVGGAAIASRRLVSGLRALGNQVAWFVGEGRQPDEALDCRVTVSLADELVYRFAWWLFKGGARCERLERWKRGRATLKALRRFDPDVINIHNIHRSLLFEVMSGLPRAVPVVWTLHDMWPLTGYCCHSMGCEKYHDGCVGECPEVDRWGVTWRRPEIEWRKKDEWFEENRGRLSFVAPSRWMADCARQRFPEYRVLLIPNVVDVRMFRPVGTPRVVREALGLPVDRRIILLGADDISDRLKCVSAAIAAIEGLPVYDGRPVQVVAFGHKTSPMTGAMRDWNLVGSIREESLLNLYYNSADLFLSSSVAESFGLTLAESVAAGTPVVSFGVGGCLDTVVDGRTGLLADVGSVVSLRNCIHRILGAQVKEREVLRASCRMIAEVRYGSSPTVAEQYTSVFQGLLGATA